MSSLYLTPQIDAIISATRKPIYTRKPVDWISENVMLPPGSAFPGYVDYRRTPYFIEPVNAMSRFDPTLQVTCMMVNQLGKTNALINPVVCYKMAMEPCSMQYLTGHKDGNAEAVRQLDMAFDSCGFRKDGTIRRSAERVRNTKSGDTDDRKDFRGGFLMFGSLTNVKADARQYSIQLQIRDDMDGAKITTASGDTHTVFKSRTDAFIGRYKILNISSPELLGDSNIWLRWQASDQRRYYMPCPHCGEFITLEFEVDIPGTPEKGGLKWKLDSANRVIESSVEYMCQHPGCGRLFKANKKFEAMYDGACKWVPTKEFPDEELHKGYQLNALWLPPGMRRWVDVINQYYKANPLGKEKDVANEQTFYNLFLGLPYERKTEEMHSTDLMVNNIRPYSAGEVPEDLSVQDGNGKFIMITCSLDMNGVHNNPTREDDARLDYEVVAWPESGSPYSIEHGSIGTFVFQETDDQKQVHRDKWTYDIKKPNNVWDEFYRRVMSRRWPIRGGGGRQASILVYGIDLGNWKEAGLDFIAKYGALGSAGVNANIVGLRGAYREDRFRAVDKDSPAVTKSKELSNFWLVDGNKIKDDLSGIMRFKWKANTGTLQPVGFMNYPSDPHLYKYENYFSHLEAEHKVPDYDKSGGMKGYTWKKKSPHHQNHCLDLRVYNIAIREVFLANTLAGLKKHDPERWRDVKVLMWPDYVKLVLMSVG